MPVISTIIGLGIAAASAGAGISGAVSAHGAEQQQKKALTQEEQIAQQQMQDKQQIFKQLSDFFTPYLGSGSPFLQNIQSAAAGQNAQQYNNQAGQFREQMGQSGMGYGPSGATAAGVAGMGQGAANAGASNYLSNLLNNEQVKFQAASGLNSAGQMAGSTQNQPNVGVTLPPANFGSSLGALGNVFQNLGQGSSTQQMPQQVGQPGSTVANLIPGWSGLPATIAPPAVQGTTP